MNPKKIKWYLGSGSYAMIMEQDRKHWLLKTDRTKTIQDVINGDTFRGRVDNLGSDIIIETEKLYTQDSVVRTGTFSSRNVSEVFDLAASTFSYIPAMNGLHFLRLKSINLLVGEDYHNFRLMLTNVEECYIPIAPDNSDPDVISCKWYKTTDRPVLQMMDGNGQWTIEQVIEFSDGVTNPVYYYPADEVLQPVEITVDNTTLTSELITDQELIGYPLLWFTCTESELGPELMIQNNTVASPTTGSKFLEIGHPGNASNYSCRIYPATGVESESVPDGNFEDWELICLNPGSGTFNGNTIDFTLAIKTVIMKHINDDYPQKTIKFVNENGNNIVTMTPNIGWEFDTDTNSYSVSLDVFSSNLYGTEEPLISAFDVHFDESISFEDTTTDTGFAGMQFGSSKNDTTTRYPHDIQNLEGLPAWIRDPNWATEHGKVQTPQHLSVYAAHNTPYYNPADQSTRQISGLIFDPGIERDYDDRFHPGKYRFLNISIVSGGSGYNFEMDEHVVEHGYYYQGDFYSDSEHTFIITPDPGKIYVDDITGKYMYDADSSTYESLLGYKNISGPNRFWIKFNDGSQSRTLVEITSVDENGGALTLNPLYVDEAGDTDIKEMIYGYYDADRRKFYTDYTMITEIQGEPDKVYKGVNTNTVYSYELDMFIPKSFMSSGTAFEETYTIESLVGNNLSTVWLCEDDDSTYTREEIMEVRNLQLSSGGSGLMDDGTPWWMHVYTSGTGLVVSIETSLIQEVEPPYTSDDVPTEEIGRVYVVSNDSPTYINNRTAANPKPERTIARICDIPTSVMQLSNISGLAPTMVVDKKYVRTEAPFKVVDQDYLYNGSKSRWVRPTALDIGGRPIYSETYTQTNGFIFDSMELLNNVDLVYHNDFRETVNLNRGVNPNDVSIASIYAGGSGYVEGSEGIIVVGGYSFTYYVTSVSSTGAVTGAILASNDQSGTLINLANFDFVSEEASSGLTAPYGTSPRDNTIGTGLKVILRIENYPELVPKKGDIFSDLFAFVSDFDGIWLVERDNGEWVKRSQLAMSYASETRTAFGEPSLRDSYLNSILPSAREISVNPMTPYATDRLMKAFVTASAINVVDDSFTPVDIPSTDTESETDANDSRIIVDINKLYCRGYSRLTASRKSEDAVMQEIKKDGGLRFDSYIFWKWVNPTDTSNFEFEYGVIHRSLNNLQTTDTTSVLPGNELDINQFVHTNAQTTIMWNVPHVGPMVWMFDPESTIHEKYYVNAHTRELYVTREEYSWNEIEITDSVDSSSQAHIHITGDTQYTIYTNNPAYSTNASTTDVIYQQPDFIKLNPVAGQLPKPKGSWRLVFPSIVTTGSYKLKRTGSEDDGLEFTPVKMMILRGANISDTTDVLNSDGDPVNYKTLLIDENTTTGRVDLRLYDQESMQWSNV